MKNQNPDVTEQIVLSCAHKMIDCSPDKLCAVCKILGVEIWEVIEFVPNKENQRQERIYRHVE